MKKTLTIIIALACAVALALGCIAAHAVTSDRSKASEQEQDVSERVDAVNEQEQDDSEKVDAVNDEVINTIRNRSYGDEMSLYEYCCAHASDEQRRQLESFEMGYKGATSELLREGYIRQTANMPLRAIIVLPTLTMRDDCIRIVNLPTRTESAYPRHSRKMMQTLWIFPVLSDTHSCCRMTARYTHSEATTFAKVKPLHGGCARILRTAVLYSGLHRMRIR